MTSSSFRAHFQASLRAALARARALEATDNQQLKGQFRELIVSQLIRPILPPDVLIGSGQLVDHLGAASRQIDIIIYNPRIAPPALIDEKNGFFPVESALYTIEVKSRLTAQTLGEALENARSVRRLNLLQGTRAESGKDVLLGAAWPVSAVFALNSDLLGSGKTEIERYLESATEEDVKFGIAAICIPEKGYWYRKTVEGSESWLAYQNPNDLSETLSFLGGVANTIPRIESVKGRIALGRYLAVDEQFQPT